MSNSFWDTTNRADLEERNRRTVQEIVELHKTIIQRQYDRDQVRAQLTEHERLMQRKRVEASVMGGTLDYLVSEFHILPDGCPEPWFSVLNAFGHMAESALKGEDPKQPGEEKRDEPAPPEPEPSSVGAPVAEATTVPPKATTEIVDVSKEETKTETAEEETKPKRPRTKKDSATNK